MKKIGILFGQENTFPPAFVERVNSKGINNWLDIKKWAGHDWQWWCQMFPEYLAQIG